VTHQLFDLHNVHASTKAEAEQAEVKTKNKIYAEAGTRSSLEKLARYVE
jgi:hypothetical protein